MISPVLLQDLQCPRAQWLRNVASMGRKDPFSWTMAFELLGEKKELMIKSDLYMHSANITKAREEIYILTN